MRKAVIIALLLFLFSLLSVPASSLANPVEFTDQTLNDVCRVTCTVEVEVMGVIVTKSATRGGLFVSCETAGERACSDAREAAQNDPFL